MSSLLFASTSGEADSTATLPSLDHLLMADYDNVYEPSEDTYLMCDALYNDRAELRSMGCSLVLEIGCGSGCNITYLASLLADSPTKDTGASSADATPNPALTTTTAATDNADRQACLALATDINPFAIDATQRTAIANNVTVECILTDLVTGLEGRLAGKVDVLLFNPPYVPTDDEEVGSADIAAAWAGGLRGRRVIDRWLPLLPGLLSPPRAASAAATAAAGASQGGRCYLVLVEENDPAEIAAYAATQGMAAQTVLRRKARNEALQIMRIQWR